MRRLKDKKALAAGTILIVLLILCALGAELFAPNPPMQINMGERYAPAGPHYPLGTDAYGRCILSRLIYGTRYSLGIAILAMAGIVLTTIPAGLAAAYRGGIGETIFLWLCDISMALPPTVLVLAILGIMGNGLGNLIFSTIFSYWGWYARMVRSHAAAELAKGYVTYAITGGASGVTVMMRHVLPNIFPGLLTLFILGISDTILMISGYSFLGIGLSNELPEWGAMLNEAKAIMMQAPHYILYPGICIVLSVLAFNLLGEGIRKEFIRKGGEERYE